MRGIRLFPATFLLTPLREGRHENWRWRPRVCELFLLTPLREGRPAFICVSCVKSALFLLTPLREGRPRVHRDHNAAYEISTHAPAGGATVAGRLQIRNWEISTHAPAGGATMAQKKRRRKKLISTHAPAGGATAIFHKSVMRFCGKLPKDDTVLCLASFGFPRRDPKAVYLVWISFANLPQKCVRQGLALKDQGTSCFHEGLASHAFNPVLV